MEMKKVNLTDHEFAAFLRAANADMDNPQHEGNRVIWSDVHGNIVAFAIYDNIACTREIYVT